MGKLETAIFNKQTSLEENTVLKVRPDLFDEWDFEKNDEIGLDIYKVTKGSDKIAWWICPKCKSNYKARISSRIGNQNCPYCAGQRVNHTNSFATLMPDLASEWHPTLNDGLTPHDVTCNSDTKVWWQCKKHEKHFWESMIKDRNKGRGCPYCSNKKVKKGINDLHTTHPHIAEMLLNPEDGYKYTYGSKEKVNWKCPDCGEVIKNKPIQKVYSKGLACRKCSDGFSYPEKFMYNVLSQINIEFETQKIFKWAKNKRYDFYLPEYNCIIETHGEQHKNSRKEKNNDSLKRLLAKNNGVEYYIEIDCSESEMEYIKYSILKSELNKLFNLSNVNWKEASLNAHKSKLIEICKYFNNIKETTHREMSSIFKIEEGTIRRYLKKGSELGLCDYIPNSKRSIEQSTNHLKKRVVQLSKEGSFIKQWNSIKDAGNGLGKIHYSSISACCRGKSLTAFGFKWMYLEDYENRNN